MDKPLTFIGASREELCGFPEGVRITAGKELRSIQKGEDPRHWKPFNEVGAGTREITIDMGGGWFRVMYVAKFEEAVYVLHCFQKKTNETSKQDKQITKNRYQEMIAKRGKK